MSIQVTLKALIAIVVILSTLLFNNNNNNYNLQSPFVHAYPLSSSVQEDTPLYFSQQHSMSQNVVSENQQQQPIYIYYDSLFKDSACTQQIKSKILTNATSGSCTPNSNSCQPIPNYDGLYGYWKCVSTPPPLVIGMAAVVYHPNTDCYGTTKNSSSQIYKSPPIPAIVLAVEYYPMFECVLRSTNTSYYFNTYSNNIFKADTCTGMPFMTKYLDNQDCQIYGDKASISLLINPVLKYYEMYTDASCTKPTVSYLRATQDCTPNPSCSQISDISFGYYGKVSCPSAVPTPRPHQVQVVQYLNGTQCRFVNVHISYYPKDVCTGDLSVKFSPDYSVKATCDQLISYKGTNCNSTEIYKEISYSNSTKCSMDSEYGLGYSLMCSNGTEPPQPVPSPIQPPAKSNSTKKGNSISLATSTPKANMFLLVVIVMVCMGCSLLLQF